AWTDSRLKWDYKDYGGLKSAHFGDGELWKPDIHVYNNAEGSEIDHYGDVHLLVSSTGKIRWVPPVIMKVPCAVNLKFWPFDTQECKIVLGSWTTHGWQVNLEMSRNTSEISRTFLMKYE
ncbi:Neuronal acetylcholine receptor subunit alpha-7, partial [Armadillidium vulgare]